MRTSLDIPDDVMLAARVRAAQERRPTGAVISDLARRGLTPARVDTTGRLPVMMSPAGASPMTPEMVRGAPLRGRTLTFDAGLADLGRGDGVGLLRA